MNFLITISFLLVLFELMRFNKFFADGFDFEPDVLYFFSENRERHSFVGKTLRLRVVGERLLNWHYAEKGEELRFRCCFQRPVI